MIACSGHSFSLVEDPRFLNVLKLAKYASAQYRPPCRTTISTMLSSRQYEQYKKESKDLLQREVKIFGLSIMGDGATIARKPLLNTLFNGVHLPVYVANIKDCSQSLSEGETKNAEYIASICIKLIKELDHNGDMFDIAFFDGAANIQKAGKCLESIFPRMSTIHGCEHVTALFCGDLAKIPKIKCVITTYMKLYNVFGSGSCHVPYAIFRKFAKQNNPTGRDIGLIRYTSFWNKNGWSLL